MGKPISFYAAYNWNDQALGMTDPFISVHALGFMWFNMVHMTNWVINGLPASSSRWVGSKAASPGPTA